MKKTIALAIAAAATIASVPAEAEVLQFTFTGDYEQTFSYDPEETTPGWSDAEENFFMMYDIPGFPTDNGLGCFYVYEDRVVVNDYWANNLLYVGYYADGAPKIWSGSPNAPVYNLGNYTFSGDFGKATLTISTLEAAVPEPASWAMMIAGFGLIGGAMRRRHTIAVA